MPKVKVGDIIYTGPNYFLGVTEFWMNCYVCEDSKKNIVLVKKDHVLYDGGYFVAMGRYHENPGDYLMWKAARESSKMSAEACLHEINRWLHSDMSFYLATPPEIRELVESYFDQLENSHE